jgi:hypothetical protein
MRTPSFEAEAAACRLLAKEYEGKAEAVLALRLATAFEILGDEQSRSLSSGGPANLALTQG